MSDRLAAPPHFANPSSKKEKPPPVTLSPSQGDGTLGAALPDAPVVGGVVGACLAEGVGCKGEAIMLTPGAGGEDAGGWLGCSRRRVCG